MTTLIEKYLSVEKVNKIVSEKKYNSAQSNEFICFITKVLEEEERFGIQEGYETGIFDYANDYMTFLNIELSNGFSMEWAKEYASMCMQDEFEKAPAYAFSVVKKKSLQIALKELEIFARITNRDDFFIKHFSYLLEVDAPSVTPSVVAQAVEYSKIYKEEIAKGKSEIFSNRYADLKASNEFTDIACLTEAIEFEKAILNNYSEKYADSFACHIAEYIANHFYKYEDALNDILVIEERKKIEKKFEHLK